MRVIVLACRKGGVGKTTLASHLAVEAERAGDGPVAVIDTDATAVLSQWWDEREAATPVLVRPEPTLPAAIERLREVGCRFVFVDTPPDADTEVAASLAAADLVLVPVQPSPNDLRAMRMTVRMVEHADKPMVFVMNRLKPRAALTAEAAVTLSQWGKIAPAWIWDRTAYAGAMTDGRTAAELDPNGKAAAEIAALWDYVRNLKGVRDGTAT